ncbi:MAG: leucyl/phenylalanyl-tRNA--protein transferase [Planctomycetota bacterium]
MAETPDHDASFHDDWQHPTPAMLCQAYAHGVFPMFHPEEDVLAWYSPDPRAVIPLETFHVPRTLGREVRKQPFQIRSDTAFELVMRACADSRPGRESTWINQELIDLYVALHQAGAAHSVEAWLGDELVGGLYGVQLGGAYFGESMFSQPEKGGTNASKICLVHLVHWLRLRGFTLLDTQFTTPHLERFGCTEIPRFSYLEQLDCALERPVSWGTFESM